MEEIVHYLTVNEVEYRISYEEDDTLNYAEDLLAFKNENYTEVVEVIAFWNDRGYFIS